MKRLLAVIIILVAANIYFASTGGSEYTYNQDKDSTGVVEPASYQSRVDKLVNAIISRYHYKKVDLNDSLSAVIFDKYINTLDFSHSYFLATDIAKFNVFKTELDDMIKDGDIEPAFEIFNTFKDRVHQQLDYAEKLLQKEFDYSKNGIKGLKVMQLILN